MTLPEDKTKAFQSILHLLGCQRYEFNMLNFSMACIKGLSKVKEKRLA